MWQPQLHDLKGPIYEQIRTAFLSDIKRGALKPGDPLPPHRDLADQLGVSVGTVSRAYKDLVDQGLIDAGARRGSRVREIDTNARSSLKKIANVDSQVVDLRGHRAAFEDWDTDIQQALLDIGLQSDLGSLLDYQPSPGLKHHREAGAKWLELTSGKPCKAEEVVVCNGAQHALVCALLASCSAGDIIATERLTYAGLRAAAPSLSLKLVPVDTDEDGIIPASFQSVCDEHSVKALVCVPNIHNPTTRTLPLKRRKEIAKIALAHSATIIEDDVYGGLSDPKIPPFYSITPDNVIRLTGLSKTLGPGLRIGYIQAQPSRIPALSTALRATSWMASPLMAEISANLISSGKAQEILSKNKLELGLRNKVLAEELGSRITTSPFSPHAWLELPESWTRDEFLNWAQVNGIKLLAAESFLVGPPSADKAVRLSVSAAPNAETLRSVASRISNALRQPPEDSNILA
ncbi:MAG: PLP-dependent aminotransferase family protein [Roseovarius sp.]|nr:PLP-dependent aminotransferase family protein [Roseovarius sp.]